MTGKPKYLTIEFWAALITAGALVAVTLGVASQEEVNSWVALLTGLVAAVLPIVALVLGYSNVRATKWRLGLVAGPEPGWMTAEFWITLGTTIAMVLVGLRVVGQAEADMWLELLGPLVAAALAIVAYIRGQMTIQAAGVAGVLK